MKNVLVRAKALLGAVILVLPITSIIFRQTAFAFGGGDGTEGTPYLVDSCADIVSISDLSAHYLLTSDLDCSANGNDITIGDANVGFSGVFDGGTHTVTVNINDTASNLGLFSFVYDGGIVRHLTVAGSVISSSYSAGLIAGYITGSTALDVHSSGNVTSTSEYSGGLFGQILCDSDVSSSSSSATVSGVNYTGGLAGFDGCMGPGSFISDSYYIGDVNGNDNVGGLLGGAYGTDLTNVHTGGSVIGHDNVGGLIGDSNEFTSDRKIFHAYSLSNVTGLNSVGGLVGLLQEGVISQSYAMGTVTSTGGDDTGGLVGRAVDDQVTIRDSYERGNVIMSIGNGNAGGLIGYGGSNVQLYNSYVTGQITTEADFGGIVGNGSLGRIQNSFWDTETTGALLACDQEGCDGTGATSSQMKSQTTYTDASWNFDTIWTIDSGANGGYPFLAGGADIIPEIPAVTGPVETILNENQFHGGGVAQNWNDDDEVWTYDLPFDFSFYGQEYDQAFVSSNGYISFGDYNNDYNFEVSDGIGIPIISALSGDLDTDCDNPGDDIYITDNDDGTVVFRWQAAIHGDCDIQLNFEIVLHSDGTFELNYGDQTGDIDTEEDYASVGVNDGEGSYVLSEYDHSVNFNQFNTSAWSWGDQPENQDTIVRALSSSEDGTPIWIGQSGCTAIESAFASKETALSVQDPAYQYPVGFAGFTLNGCSSSATITATFTGIFDPNKVAIRKYNSVTNTYTTLTPANSGLVLTTTTLEGKPALQAVYSIVDGGPLDQDGTVNGTIIDPIGVALSTVGVPNTGFSL